MPGLDRAVPGAGSGPPASAHDAPIVVDGRWLDPAPTTCVSVAPLLGRPDIGRPARQLGELKEVVRRPLHPDLVFDEQG